MSSLYHLGRATEVIIRMPGGEELTISNLMVEVDIETETLDHHSLSGGMDIIDRTIIVREEKTVKIHTDDGSIIEELTRLIRED